MSEEIVVSIIRFAIISGLFVINPSGFILAIIGMVVAFALTLAILYILDLLPGLKMWLLDDDPSIYIIIPLTLFIWLVLLFAILGYGAGLFLPF